MEELKEIMQEQNTTDFKTFLGGYRKKEVDHYISNLNATLKSSISSYEEKIESLKNYSKMTAKELEDANNFALSLQERYQEAQEKLKTTEDHSAYYEQLREENEQLKEQLQTNENYLTLAEERKAKNDILEEQNISLEQRKNQLETKIKELENEAYQYKLQIGEGQRQLKVTLAQAQAEIEMTNKHHLCEVNKITQRVKGLQEELERMASGYETEIG